MRVSLIGTLLAILLAAAGSPPASAQPVQKPISANHGNLVVYSMPWARIWVDGKDTGRTTPITPRAAIQLKPGKHKLTFVVGDQRHNYTVTIEAGKTTKITKQLPVDE